MKPLPTDLTHITGAGELHDRLQEMFGIGDFDDLTSEDAWYKHRMVEIMKIKGLCRRRRATYNQVAIAAWYAKENQISVAHTVTLFALIPKAMVEFRTMEREAAAAAEKEELEEAVGYAIDIHADEWADQLLRAAPGNARSVLTAFRKEHP